MLRHCKSELQPGPADSALQRRCGLGRQAARGRLQVRIKGCCGVIGHAGTQNVLRASFVCVQDDCRLQVQNCRHLPLAATLTHVSRVSASLPAPAPTHRLCSWVHTLWLESNDIGPAVSLPLRNAFARNLHLSIASDPGPTVCVYRGPRNSQRGCVCTLALLTCHWLKTPCAPKDWSTSAKRWRVSFMSLCFPLSSLTIDDVLEARLP